MSGILEVITDKNDTRLSAEDRDVINRHLANIEGTDIKPGTMVEIRLTTPFKIMDFGVSTGYRRCFRTVFLKGKAHE